MRLDGFDKIKSTLLPVVGFALLGLAIWTIAREIRSVGFDAVERAFHSIPRPALLVALALTPCAYALLTGYDFLGFAYIGKKLGWQRIAFAAFIGYAFSNSVSMVPSIAVRYRLYSHWGVSTSDISRVLAFHILSTWLGFLGVAGVILLFDPTSFAPLPWLDFSIRRGLGASFLFLIAAYFTLSRRLRGGFRYRGFEFRFPPVRLVLAQSSLALLDWSLIALIPYLLIPMGHRIPYPVFLSSFLVAQATQMASHVPGGIGVFEGTMLVLLRSRISSAAILAGLLIYRMVYMVLPLLVASLILLGFELGRRRPGTRAA